MAATSIGFSVGAIDRASGAFEEVARAVDGLHRELRNLDKATANPTVDVDTSKASKKVGAFATDLQRRIKSAVDSLPDIELDADASEADRAIAEIRRELASLADQQIGIDVDTGAAHARVQQLQAQLADLSGSSSSIAVRADTAAAAAALAMVESRADALDRKRVNVKVDVDSGAAVAKMATLGTAATSAGGNMAGMGGRAAVLGTVIAAVAAPAIGLLSAAVAALPSVMAVGGAAIGAIALGMDGIKRAAETAKPALDGLKAAVSASFESSLAPAMQGIAAMIPQFTSGFQQVATAIGGTATQLVNMFNTAAGVAQINGLLTGTAQVIQAMQPGVLALAQNFMTLASSGLVNFMMPLAGHLSAAAQGFGQMIAQAQATGALQGALTGLADTFGVLLGFFNNLIGAGLQAWSVLAGPMNTAFSLLGQVIVALMPALTALTQMFLAVLNPVLAALLPIIAALTPAFTQLAGMIGSLLGGALTAITPLLTAVAQMLGGVLTQALNAIAPIIPVIVQAFGTLAGALMPIVPVIGQLATTLIGALAPVIPVIASAFGTLVGALAPILPMIAQLAGQLVSALAPILPVIAGAFSAVLAAVMPILPVLMQMVTGIFPVLSSLIAALAPVVGILAQAFMGVVTALLPLIPAAMSIVTAILPIMVQLIAAVAPLVAQLAMAFAQVVAALVPLIPPIVQLITALLPPLLAVLTAVLPIFVQLATIIVSVVVVAIQVLVSILTTVIGVVTTVLAAVVGFIAGLVTGFTTFLAMIPALWTAAWTGIQTAAITIWTAISTFFTTAFAAFVAFFAAIWNGIIAVFTAVWTGIQTAAITAWTAVSSFFTTAFAAFTAFFSQIWMGIQNVWTAVWGMFSLVAQQAWNAIVAFLTPAFTAFQAFFTMIWNAIVAVFTAVWNSIRTAAVTVWNAIVAFLQPAFTAFQAFFTTIWNAISLVFTTVWNFIYTTAMTIWTTISTFFTTAFAAFTAFFSTIWNNILAFFVSIWTGIQLQAVMLWTIISTYFSTAFAAFTAFFSNVWNNILAFFVSIWTGIQAQAVALWNIIATFFSDAFAAFTGFFTDTWNTIVGIFDRVWSSVVDIAKRVWDNVRGAFIGGVNVVIDIINGFANAINMVAGLLGFNINLHVNRLEDGGPVAPGRMDGGTIAYKSVIGRATGGGIDAAGGGKLPGRNKPGRDMLPATAGRQPYRLDGGEYVTNRYATAAVGQAGMNAINNAHRQPVDIVPRRKGGATALAGGGPVLSEETARAHAPFLRALKSGQPEAVQATGSFGGERGYLRALAEGDGRAEMAAGKPRQKMPGFRSMTPPQEFLKPIPRDLGGAIAFAKSMSGKPYVWGGTNPAVGTDCSGYQGMITRVLRNQSPARIGSTADFPWPGFVNGLGSAYSVGSFKGSPGHMAGTLAGVNVESGGSPSRVKYGAGAVGADHGQFGIKAHLPEAGGVFASGGGGGGGGLSFGQMARDWLDPLYRLMIPIRDNHGEGLGNRTGAGAGVWLLDQIVKAADALGGGGGATTAGIDPGGPVVEQVRAVARQFGWDTGPEWEALSRIIHDESGWDPNAANPNSSARGLFQKMTSIHGPVEPTAAGQAAWGINYIRDRYGSPTAARRYWEANKHYDRGGIANGTGLMMKETLTPERVLSGRQTRSFEQLVGSLTSGRPQAIVANGAVAAQMAAAQSGRGRGGSVTVLSDNSDTVSAISHLQAEVTQLGALVKEARPVNVYARNDDASETGRAVALQMRL